MEDIIKLVEALAWPLTTIILGLSFRKEFRQILARFSKLKYKDFEANFDKELSKIENRTEKLLNKPDEIISSFHNDYYLTHNRLSGISAISPRAAISEAWRELEVVTTDFIKSLGYDHMNVQMSKIFRNILIENNYPISIYEDYKDLRILRNKAVHTSEFELSSFDADRYITTALDLIIFIKNLSKNTQLQNSK